MKVLFGTDGVRGVANTELTPELAFKLGRAGAYVLTKKVNHTAKVLIAADGRRSGDMLEAALTAGMCSIGAQVYKAGILPTPAVAYLVGCNKMDAGVMISASHNLMADNGIKFFSSEGYKLPDEMEREIEELVNNEIDNIPRPTGEGVGTVMICHGALEDYTRYLLMTVSPRRFDGLRIAMDCANGATSSVAHIVFEWLGARVYKINDMPDGTNINEDCGSTHMKSLQNFMKRIGADVGLAFDGDGDRMLALTEDGEIIDGDAIMAICALGLKEKGELAKDMLVATVMSNQGLEVFCKENGINLLRTDVGDRYVLERMLAEDALLGGEQSGHIIYRKHGTTGDGILTGLQLVSMMASKKEPLSSLAKTMDVFPQVLLNATVPNNLKPEMATCKPIQDGIKDITDKLGSEGRILVRPSGTEPVVRVMIEGRNINEITFMAETLVKIIEENLV